MALQLNAAQVQRLQQIQLQRDTDRLAGVLASQFPDVPARIGDRYPALVAHAVQRGAAHGLVHALCVGRLLGCWFMLGAEFETRPGFEWARQLLGDAQRSEGAKVFQLCRRTRELLAGGAATGRPAPAPMSAPAFDQAIAGVDAALLDFGAIGSLQRGGRVALGQACDLDAVDLRLLGTAAGANPDAVNAAAATAITGLQHYRVDGGQWRRVPHAASSAPVSVQAAGAGGSGHAGFAPAARSATATGAVTPANGPAASAGAADGVGYAGSASTASTAGAVGGAGGDTGMAGAAGAAGGASTALPPRLHLLAALPGAAPARLRLRTRAASCCDPQVHPLVRLNGPDGIHEWRGRDATDITLDLYAQPPPAAEGPADALQPPIAAETAAQVSTLSLAACGLRDGGPPLGELGTQIAVYPAEQHLLTWRREARPPSSWPEPAGGQPAAAPPRCRIERDGVALNAARWQAGLAELDHQLDAALSRLYAAWERESGVEHARMEAEPALLCGDAGLSWGWSAGDGGLPSAPFLRLAGQLDLVVCQLNLRLSGELALHGSRSRLALHSHGRTLLQPAWQRSAADAALLPPATPLQVEFRHPFVVELQTLATAELAVADASPASGAVVGSAGLRPRADGAGLQWFARLAIEPAQLLLHWHDPLLGQQTVPRPLLPALALVDWSLG